MNANIIKKEVKLKIKRTATGLGLFAAEPIAKRALVVEYAGEIISPKEGDARNSRYIFSVNKHKDIDGKVRSNIARYINHSCRPNAESELVGDRVFIRALKNIATGEEIVYDYGKEYFDEYIKPKGCRCVRCMQKNNHR